MRVIILACFLLGNCIIYGQQELEWEIEPILEYDDISVLSEGLAWAQKNRKWGLINTSGEVLTDFEFFLAYPFSEGLSRVRKNGKFGFVNTSGILAVPVEFGYAWDFSEGLAAVEKDNKWGFINFSGQVIIPFQYDYAEGFSEGLAAVKKDNKWSYINKSGKKVIQLGLIDNANEFSEGLAWVKKDGKYGLINTSGKFIIDYKYHYVWEFSEGLATVELNRKWGYINTSGKLVTKLEYEHALNFSEGLAQVEKNRKIGYINTSGEVVIDFEYVYTSPFMEGLAWVTKNGYWGIINSSGEMVTQYEFEDVGNFSDSLAFVKKDGKWGLIRHPFYKKTPYTLQSTTNSKSKGKNYALFIGISEYQYRETLTTPVNDCNALIDVLTEQYDFERQNIITLYNESATRKNILEIIQKLTSELNASDNLFLYFSGHSLYDESYLKGFWIPYEVKKTASQFDMVSNDEIIYGLSQLHANNIYIIADAYFSNAVTYSSQILNSLAVFSSGKKETNTEKKITEISSFAKILIDFLSEYQKEELTISTLEEEIYISIIAETDNVPHSAYSINSFSGNDKSQFIFYRKR